MIEWLTPGDLESLLAKQGTGPLRLRPFLHGRATGDANSWFDHAPAIVEQDGLGPTLCWSGLIGGVPFAITAAARHTGWGFEVRLPQLTAGDAAMVRVVRAIGLPTFTDPYFESLPCDDGCGVAAERSPEDVIYRGPSPEDARAVVDALNAACDTPFVVVPKPQSVAGWIVAGPIVGPYITDIVVVPDEASARAEASRMTTVTGAEYRAVRA